MVLHSYLMQNLTNVDLRMIWLYLDVIKIVISLFTSLHEVSQKHLSLSFHWTQNLVQHNSARSNFSGSPLLHKQS